MPLTPPYENEEPGLQTPVPYVPPRPGVTTTDNFGTSGPTLNNYTNTPSERKVLYAAKNAKPPIKYGPSVQGGIFTYPGYFGSKIALPYIWANGGTRGINGIQKIVLNDSLTLDVSNAVHGVELNYFGDLSGWSVTNYFGKLDQGIDPTLASCYNLTDFSDDYHLTNAQGRVACVYSVVVIPNPNVNLESRNLPGFPRAKAFFEGMVTYNYNTQVYDYNAEPAYYAADFITSQEYGMRRLIDETSLEAMAARHRELLTYETESGTNTIPRLRASLSIDRTLDDQQLFQLFEDVCECWIDDSGERVVFLSDSPRTIDIAFSHSANDFIGHPRVSTVAESQKPNHVVVEISDEENDLEPSDAPEAFLPGVEGGRVAPVTMTLRRSHLPAYAYGYRRAVLELNKTNGAYYNVDYRVGPKGIDATRGQVHSLSHPFAGDNVLVRCTRAQRIEAGIYQCSGVRYSDDFYNDFVLLQQSGEKPLLPLIGAPEPTGLQLNKRLDVANGLRRITIEAFWDDSDWVGFASFQVIVKEADTVLIDRTQANTSLIVTEFRENSVLSVSLRTLGQFDSSEWITASIDTDITLLSTPAPVKGFNLQVTGNLIIARWNFPVPAENLTYDVRFYTPLESYESSRRRELTVNNFATRADLTDGIWNVGIVAENNAGLRSAVETDSVAIILDQDFRTAARFQVESLDLNPPTIDYNAFPNKVKGGSAGIVCTPDGRYITEFGAVCVDGTDCLSYYSVGDVWTDPLNTYLQPTVGEVVSNPNLNDDPGFDNPGHWTLGAGWSISSGKLIATNVSNTEVNFNLSPNPVLEDTMLVLNYALDTYAGGQLGVRVGSNLQMRDYYSTRVGQTVGVFHNSVNTASLIGFRGESNFNGQLDNFNVWFAQGRVAGNVLDLGAPIDGFVGIETGSGFYTNGNVSKLLEISVDGINFEQVNAPYQVEQIQYIRPVLQSTSIFTTFHGRLDELVITIDSKSRRETGAAVWNPVPPVDRRQAIEFIPDVVGGGTLPDTGKRVRTEYGVLGGPAYWDIVDTRNQRSYMLQFQTGTDVTARQLIYASGEHGNSMSVQVVNGELQIIGYLGGFVSGNPHTSFSRQTVLPNNDYTVVWTYDNTDFQFRTYINGKRAEIRSEFIDSNTNMATDFAATSAQDIGQPTFGGDSGQGYTTDVDGVPLGSSFRGWFGGVISRFIQWNDRELTAQEVFDKYVQPWSTLHAGDVILDYSFGDVDVAAIEIPDHSGNNLIATVDGGAATFDQTDMIIISAWPAPVVGVLNKEFSSIFSVAATSSDGDITSWENLELTVDPNDSGIKQTIEFTPFDALTGQWEPETVNFRIEGL